MTLKELMLGNLSSGQNTAILQLGSQSAQKTGGSSGGSDFGEIFGSRLSSRESQDSTKRSNSGTTIGKKSTEPVASREDSRPRYVSYREASENAAKEKIGEGKALQRSSAADRSDDKGSKVEEDDAGKKPARGNEAGNMLQALAQVMGIGMQDLQKLLKAAGIAPESFDNREAIRENVSKLSELLGLNNEQQDTLSKLLELTAQTLGIPDTAASAATTENKPAAGTEQRQPVGKASEQPVRAEETPFAKLQEATGQKTEQPAVQLDSLLKKLNAEIKTKLDELGQQLANDQSSVKTELEKLLQPLKEKAAPKVQETFLQENPANEAVPAEEPEIAATAAAEDSGKEEDAGKETKAKPEMATVIPQSTAGRSEAVAQPVFTAVRTENAPEVEAVQKAAARTPVTAKEIISQVMEKAKVVLTADKSEMVVDLKPDSLGKLSLKIVTENGSVMAKFVAESQQVKQILESNMNLLKDSLERQGMNVQGFSVSVRQDSNGSADRWTRQDGGRSRGFNQAAYRTTGIEGGVAGAFEPAVRNNPYGGNWGSSTINLTA
jgi:flagellar hook-length control protein FliK